MNKYDEFTANSCYGETLKFIEELIWDKINKAKQNGEFAVVINRDIPLIIREKFKNLGYDVQKQEFCLEPWKDNPNHIRKWSISWKKCIKIVEGNIFNCKENIIVHQTNCQGVMGHGIALQVKQKYPEVYENYKDYCNNHKPENILGETLIIEGKDGKFIANVFGQLNYGEGLQTDYDRLEKGLMYVREFALSHSLSVAIPYKIGCGLAHGNWDTVSKIICDVFADVNCTIYQYELTRDNYGR